MMAERLKLDWFAFNIKEYVATTLRLTTLGHGVMIKFMCHYWEHGSLPDGDEAKIELVGIDPSDWPKIKMCLIGKNGYLWTDDWRNPRLDAAREQAEQWYLKRLERIKAPAPANRPEPIEWVEIRSRIFKRDDYTCTYCGVRGGDLECDHMIPVCQGGSSEDDNLTTACKPCNRDKGPRTVEQWRAA